MIQSSLASFIGMVAICNKPGSIGTNRYGPDPRKPEIETGGSGTL